MSIKKYSSGSWVTVPYRKYETATDTITSLPQTIIGDGQPISAYTIKGNMTQSGTPTPSNPVYPQETGEKTANLFDKNATDTNNGYVENAWINASNVTTSETGFNVSEYIPCLPSQQYTLKYRASGVLNSPSMCFYDASHNFISGISYSNSNPKTFTTPSNAAYCRLSYRTSDASDVMLNTGSTAKPYEPFGYKIPILSNGNTYPIYLSEPIRKIGDYADTAPSSGAATRRIKKMVLTGDENWQKSSDYTYYLGVSGYERTSEITSMSTHYLGQNNVASGDPIAEGSCCFYYGVGANVFYVKNINPYSTAQDFKAFLAAQYTNGTPVTVWYVLETATTEQFTAPTIPTSGTAQSFDVDTTLKPSEVSLTYHGWHEHNDTKFTTP